LRLLHLHLASRRPKGNVIEDLSKDSTIMAFSDFLLRGLGQALAATPAVIFGAVSASCAETTDLLTSI